MTLLSNTEEKGYPKQSIQQETVPSLSVSTSPFARQTSGEKVLIILRGPAGCGKSTFCQKILGLDNAQLPEEYKIAIRKFHVCSTDDYFLRFVPFSPPPPSSHKNEKKEDQMVEEGDKESKEGKSHHHSNLVSTTTNITTTSQSSINHHFSTGEDHQEAKDNYQREKEKGEGEKMNASKSPTTSSQRSKRKCSSSFPLLEKFCFSKKETYSFDPSRVGFYHQQNQLRVRNQMLLQVSPLVIDNTNITASAMKPYVALADEFHYDILILNPEEFSNQDTNPILDPKTKKFNRQLIHQRAILRAEDGSGKVIPPEIINQMIDGFETNANVTVDDIRKAEDYVPPNKKPKMESERKGEENENGKKNEGEN